MPKKGKLRQEELESRLRNVAWRDLSLISTELDEMDHILSEPYEFPEFVADLRSKKFGSSAHPVYAWLQTEAIFINGNIHVVPVIVAFDSAVPPPALYAHDSVQSTESQDRSCNALGGRPLPMRRAQLSWVPYFPRGTEEEAISLGVRPPLVVLNWEGRHARVKGMNEFELHYYNYLNPYILLPRVMDHLEKPEVLNVSFVWEYGGKKMELDFDKTMDRLATFIPVVLEDNGLGEEAKESLEGRVRAAFKEARANVDKQWEELQAEYAKYSEEEKKLLREAKLYKYYPSRKGFDLLEFRSPRVNRYYGNADEVLGGDPKNAVEEEVKGEEEEEKEEIGKPQKKRARKN